jgi:hypothetical protein
LELNGADHKFIRKNGLNLDLYNLKYRKYYVERLPVLVSGYDKPETTDEEYYDDSEVLEEQFYVECNCTLQNPCKKCQEIRYQILKSSSEETGEEKPTTTDDDDTPYLSSEDTDTDWDDPHNGQHPNCTDCEIIREDDCEDAECTALETPRDMRIPMM